MLTFMRLVWRFSLVLAVLYLRPYAHGQSILDEELPVADTLQPLDALIRDQLVIWFDERDAAGESHGRDSAEWFESGKRFNPITVHGTSVLKYARDHGGTPEALVCLAYIIDWGEGRPRDLYVSACNELVTYHRDDPALSWLCSRCTNAIFWGQMRSFLTRLRSQSANVDVQAAASFHLAELLDAMVQQHDLVPEARNWSETAGAGMLKACPEIGRNLESLARLNRDELADERDKLLTQVKESFGKCKPWSTTRTFGRLDYEFHEDPDGRTFRQLAESLSYEIKNVREGCIAPDFNGTLSDGQPFRLSDRRGQPTLLMFSFKGCGPCQEMYPSLRAVQERFSNTGFSVIGVMVDQEVDTVIAAQESDDISWPCVWDGPSGPIAETYNVGGYPTVLLLDRDGRIVARGLRHEKQLVAHIEKVVKQK
jgi:cytochrome oxidase Cu insertion factor (SCO1/SenC/PrrC family)